MLLIRFESACKFMPAVSRPYAGPAPAPAPALPHIGPVLVVCFTNHALDSFLEGLLEAGVTDSIVRVGGNSKSERLQPYNLHNMRKQVGERGCDDIPVRTVATSCTGRNM